MSQLTSIPQDKVEVAAEWLRTFEGKPLSDQQADELLRYLQETEFAPLHWWVGEMAATLLRDGAGAQVKARIWDLCHTADDRHLYFYLVSLSNEKRTWLRLERLLVRALDSDEGTLRAFASELLWSQSPATSHARAILSRFLVDTRELDTSSCTFYLRDPWWPDEYRLLFMPGVKLTEPMYGFMSPPSAKRLVAQSGDAEIYFPDVAALETLAGELDPQLAETPYHKIAPIRTKLAAENKLFGNFVRREGVLSCARLQERDDKGVLATLFVNFKKPVTFENPLKQRLKTLLKNIVTLLPQMTQELADTSPLPLAGILRIFQPAEHMAANGFREPRSLEDLKGRFGDILGTVFESLGLRTENTLGTVHLYNQETATLELVAQKGRIDNLDDALAQSVTVGDGVITWVVLRHQSILIEDLEHSDFKSIHKRIRDGVRSELAVPMLAENELIGVLNLESTERATFSPEAVRIVSYAARLAASSFRLFREMSEKRDLAQMIKELLQLCHQAAVTQADDRSPRDGLAKIFRDSLKADRCHIWRRCRDRDRFECAGSTERASDSDSVPRSRGWSNYIYTTKWPICISNVKSEKQFDAFSWNPTKKTWQRIPPETDVPDAVNKQFLSPVKIECEFGVPIIVQDECIGVAWLKYIKPLTELPSDAIVSLATGFAGETALVLITDEKGRVDKVPSLRTVSLATELTDQAAPILTRAR